MAGSGDKAGSEDVQSYLEQHKISSLFESLMSKIVKERPADPIEFLIGKLQGIQRQKKKQGVSLAHTTASTFGYRSRIQVTGKAVTPKSSATNKVSKSADPTSKPSDSRPTKPRTAGMTSSSTSALKKPTTKTTTTKSTPSRPVTSSSGLKAPTSIPRTTSPASRRPTTAPGGSRAANASHGRSSAAAKKDSKLPAPSSLGKSPASSTSSLSRSPRDKAKAATVTKKSSPAKASRVKEEVKEETKHGDDARRTHEASAEKISEFFGEAKKSSLRQQLLQTQSESDEDSEFEDSKRRKDVDSDEDDEMELALRKSSELDIEEILQKRQRSRGVKKSHLKLQSLLCPSPADTSTSSLGYHSDGGETDSSGENEGVEISEDHALLEDEGVTGLPCGRHAIHKIQTTPDSAKVDLKVTICSRCARVIADGEERTEVSSSRLTNQTFSHSLDGDFESASQVQAGSQLQFPQWEAGSTVSGSEIGRGSSGRSQDQSSDVTLQSCDTWGGLAPPTRVPDIPSETDSEVHLPPPPPLEGKSWLPEPPSQHDPHGWGTTH